MESENWVFQVRKPPTRNLDVVQKSRSSELSAGRGRFPLEHSNLLRQGENFEGGSPRLRKKNAECGDRCDVPWDSVGGSMPLQTRHGYLRLIVTGFDATPPKDTVTATMPLWTRENGGRATLTRSNPGKLGSALAK